jgi:hypothetical protein
MTYELSESAKKISFVAHGGPTTILSAVGMLMYPDLLEPKLNVLSGKMKFGALLVFRKDYSETNGWKTVGPAAINAALERAVPGLTMAGLQSYPNFKFPHTSGDAPKYLKKDGNKLPIPGDYKAGFGPDIFTIKAEAQPDRKPKLLEANGSTITDPARAKELFYGGALVRAMFNAYPWGWSPPLPGKGVNFGLTALQFVHPGQQRFDGAPDPEEAMGAIPMEDMAGSFPAPGLSAPGGLPAPQGLNNLFASSGASPGF